MGTFFFTIVIIVLISYLLLKLTALNKTSNQIMLLGIEITIVGYTLINFEWQKSQWTLVIGFILFIAGLTSTLFGFLNRVGGR